MMDFQALLSSFLTDTVSQSIGAFRPELTLCGGIVLLLLGRLFNLDKWLPAHWIALLSTLVALGLAFAQAYQFQQPVEHGGLVATPIFTGLLVFDKLTVFFKLFLCFFLILVITLTVLSGIPDEEDAPDFYTLMMGAVVGMLLMVGANHLLVLFLSVEMVSVPSYVLVGFLKGRKLSSEAALKFVVYGAGSAGVMLFGISLIAGLLGTGQFPLLIERAGMVFSDGTAGMADPAVRTLVLGILMILVGFAFKLSIVPFHFWCPDAFQGASAEVGGFLSVASKAATFALLVRFCNALVSSDLDGISTVYQTLGVCVGMIGALSATFGNLAAYTQKNIKRLLAYSTIAHAGYMLMAVSALLVILGTPPVTNGYSPLHMQAMAEKAVEGLLYYLCVYMFMNLGAFAIVAFIRNQIYSEEIDDYAGIAYQAPLLAVAMCFCMFSLVGLPPFGGFVGKLMIFASVYQAAEFHWAMWIVLIAGGFNTIFSLVYYIRVLKVMIIQTRPTADRIVDCPAGSTTACYVALVCGPVLALGVWIEPLSRIARDAASVLFSS